MAHRFLLIGGGLAGTFLTAHLLEAGEEVVLVDHPGQDVASAVAAGLYNTVTGQRAARTWQAETLVAALEGFFARSRYAPFRRFLHPWPLFRPLKTPYEFNEWSRRAGTADYPFVTLLEQPQPGWNAPLGCIRVDNAGWLEVPAFLQAIRIDWQQTEPRFTCIEARADYLQLDPERQCWTIAGETLFFDHVVFCEGMGIAANPWADAWPVVPLKGELLEIEARLPLEEAILVEQCFVVPRGKGRFRVGATYERTFTGTGPTPAGRAHLLDRLRRLFVPMPEVRVLAQAAGIRPTSPDRRPLLGTHRQHPCLHVFNGLGTKGVLLAPWSAEVLVRYLLGGQPLPTEVNAGRFAGMGELG